MSDHTIFGAGTPTLAASGDATPVNLAVGVYQLSGSPWEIRGVRFYVPAGTPGLPSTGYGVYVYGGTVTGGKGVPVSPALAAVFTSDPVLAGQWNELRFATPIAMPSGSYFFPAVYFPGGLYGAATTRFTAGSVQASDGSQLYAAGNTEINPGNGLYKYDPAGVMPSVSGNGTWYGIDVIAADINDVSRALSEDVTVGETITAVRTGLPASINIAASATDTLGLVATDTLNATVAGATGSTLIQRSILGERLIWGSIIDQTNKGPLFADDATPLTGSVRFRLQWEAKITGGRIYKAPAFTGDMPVTLWAPDGTKLAETQITGLTADGGGWVDYRFPAAVDGAPGGLYTVSYYSPDGIYAYSPWFWHVQDWVVPPFVVPLFKEAAAARSDGAAFTTAPGNVLPTLATATSYYVDVNVEWYVNTPRYNGGREYLQQWTNGQPVASFPVGVFFADPPFLTDYASIGVNTLVAGYTSDEYIAAVKAANMDWYPTVGASAEVIIAATEILDDPVLAARVRGYFLGDEPDMVNDPVYGWRSPQFFKDLRAALRAVDSTRPVMLNLGKWPPLNMTYAWLPPGALPQEVNAHWRDYADAVDLISSDFYNMTSDQNLGVFGIWTYPHITRRMFELSDGRTPVWGYVESTSQVPGEPTPAQVYRASWAHLIAGARGIVFFDHRFADSDVTQDFAALLHNPAMRSQVQSLSTQLQALSAPLVRGGSGPRDHCHLERHDGRDARRVRGRRENPDPLHDARVRRHGVPVRAVDPARVDDRHVHRPDRRRQDGHRHRREPDADRQRRGRVHRRVLIGLRRPLVLVDARHRRRRRGRRRRDAPGRRDAHPDRRRPDVLRGVPALVPRQPGVLPHRRLQRIQHLQQSGRLPEPRDQHVRRPLQRAARRQPRRRAGRLQSRDVRDLLR
jgi:hypothetical protein